MKRRFEKLSLFNTGTVRDVEPQTKEACDANEIFCWIKEMRKQV